MDNYWDIYTEIYLKEDADLLSEELDRLLEAMYSGQVKDFENILYENVRISVADKIKELVGDKEVDKEELLRGVKDNINKLKLLRITISFEPTRGSLTRIAKWAKQNISKYIIIDYSYDKDIVGGVVVEFEGGYKDYSIKKNFDEFILKEKEEIISLLNQ